MEQAQPTDTEERSLNVDPQKTDILNKIIKINSINNVVPIISNSFRIEQVFQNEKKITDFISKTPEFLDEDLTIDEQLTKIWAKQIPNDR
jgi:hypothetical protein